MTTRCHQQGIGDVPMSEGQVQEALYNEVQCIMGNGHMLTPPSPWTDRMTDRHDWKHYLPAASLTPGNKLGHRAYLPPPETAVHLIPNRDVTLCVYVIEWFMCRSHDRLSHSIYSHHTHSLISGGRRGMSYLQLMKTECFHLVTNSDFYLISHVWWCMW